MIRAFMEAFARRAGYVLVPVKNADELVMNIAVRPGRARFCIDDHRQNTILSFEVTNQDLRELIDQIQESDVELH